MPRVSFLAVLLLTLHYHQQLSNGSQQKGVFPRDRGVNVCPWTHFLSSPWCVKRAERVKGYMWVATGQHIPLGFTWVIEYCYSMCPLQECDGVDVYFLYIIHMYDITKTCHTLYMRFLSPLLSMYTPSFVQITTVALRRSPSQMLQELISHICFPSSPLSHLKSMHFNTSATSTLLHRPI